MSKIKSCSKYSSYGIDEPPEKLLISDGDLFIKELAQKQQVTNINLKDQLLNAKKFEKSSELISLSNYLSGPSTLQQFENFSQHFEETERLKSIGFTVEDIKLLHEFQEGKISNRHIEQRILKDRIGKLCTLLREFEDTRRNNNIVVNEIQARHKREFGLSVKPDSLQTKLLKFALENQHENEKLPHPMDDIKKIETQLFSHVNEKYLCPNKIQKRIRKLASKTSSISHEHKHESQHNRPKGMVSFVNNTKWDQKECQPLIPTKDKKNVYICKPQNYYTIKNGQIVKFKNDEIKTKNLDLSKKMSLEEIKQLPKFKNYEKGSPSKILYLKNLQRNITETDLKNIFLKFNVNDNVTFRIMTGKMKGQAFVTFLSQLDAAAALEELNGILLGDKPIIIEFGKQTKC